MPSHLGWIVLEGSSRSSDEQVATRDEAGSYGPLMDAIDRVLEQIAAEEKGGGSP